MTISGLEEGDIKRSRGRRGSRRQAEIRTGGRWSRYSSRKRE
jgi:hypothetical protein